MNTEIKILEQFFAAINRDDIETMIKGFDPEIVRIELEGFPTAGTHRDITAASEG